MQKSKFKNDNAKLKIVTRHDHFNHALHITMQVGLYLHPTLCNVPVKVRGPTCSLYGVTVNRVPKKL